MCCRVRCARWGFAVFRLQANTTHIAEEYAAAKYWLKADPGLTAAESLTSQTVKDKLVDLKAQGNKPATEALDKILNAETFTKKLTYKASKPLKWWGLIFFFSMAGVPFVKALEGIAGIITIFGFLIVVGVALWKSKRFIQKCLAFD